MRRKRYWNSLRFGWILTTFAPGIDIRGAEGGAESLGKHMPGDEEMAFKLYLQLADCDGRRP
ncbi:hypothetical protein [Nitratireductor sp. GCM10026969]|uniref:hypothetical protein n=1 Tax=Nitratireductor sp. GCM10026969 TaxID=3252645 RepID=UPI0036237914